MRRLERSALWAASGLAAAAASYAAWVGAAWLHYGRAAPPTAGESDAVLDAFMPRYDVVERHTTRVDAPAAMTLRAAAETDLQQSRIIRAIFRTREFVLRAPGGPTDRPRGLVAETKALGWGVLAEIPDREIIMGAVTQPWLGIVVFRALPPDEFAAFSEPGYVKIVWTLRADPIDARTSCFRTETRVVATDAVARQKFRGYWARFSPGIVLIRRLALGLLKTDAEARVAGGR
jgi:hypothetical protein